MVGFSWNLTEKELILLSKPIKNYFSDLKLLTYAQKPSTSLLQGAHIIYRTTMQARYNTKLQKRFTHTHTQRFFNLIPHPDYCRN